MKPYRDLSSPIEPITIAECRAHLNLVPDVDSNGESHPDDDLIIGFLGAAREYAEQWSGLVIARRQIELSFDEFPDDGDPLELGVSPVVELIEVAYTVAGVELSSNDSDETVSFLLDDRSIPAQIKLGQYVNWPLTDVIPNAVKVRLDAGYSGDDSSDNNAQPIPKAVRAAILLLLGHLYENREASVEKALSEIPLGVEALLRLYRFKLGMA